MRITTITVESAQRRFDQGLTYLAMGIRAPAGVDQAPALAVVATMSYLGAFAFPDDNIYLFKQRLRALLPPLGPALDVDWLVNTGVDVAEIFRRPWTEPQATGTRTI